MLLEYFRGNTPILDSYFDPFMQQPKGFLILSRVQRRDDFPMGPGCCENCSDTWALWPNKCHGDKTVTDGDSVSLWQAPRFRSLGFWAKLCHPLQITTLLLEKQVLAYCWALEKTGLFQSEVPLTLWVLAGPSNHRVECTQQYSLMKWEW